MADKTESIASKITEKLVEKAIDGVLAVAAIVKSEFTRIQSVESELGKLNDTRRRIDALLSDTEQRRYIEDDAVLLWLRNLKAVAFDAEDLDEEFKNIQTGNGRKRKRESLYMSSRRQLANRIDEIRDRYNTISEDRKNLRLMAGEAIWRQPKRLHPYSSSQESSLQGNGDVVHGRSEEICDIVGFLTAVDGEPNEDLQVVSIFGGGGIGKTTLARRVFIDDAVNGYFGLKIWVGCYPGLDSLKVMKQIIESGSENEECCPSSLDWMHHRVKGIVSNKRFLLVLDNVWDEKSEFWEQLKTPLTYGAAGSKVLITTRSQKVLENVRAACKVELPELSVNDSWLLFQDRVFATANQRNSVLEENPVLERIGMEIVKRCHGLPLAVKSIGGLLYSVTDDSEWRCLLNDMQHNEDVRNNVMPTLKVSYDHLPLHLKRCFSFCSVLPVGYEFDKDELVRLWMAVGLIKSNERRVLEYLGGKYFTELLCRSFFQISDSYQKGRQKYKMPSMIHDLASFVSKFETFREDNNDQHAGTARYGWLNNLEPATIGKVFENKGLRALILCGDNAVLTRQLFCYLIEKLRLLRALDLSNSRVEELPGSIENLILLRYLNLYNTQITAVPESVGNLCNLQTLDLGMCQKLTELPDSIGYLKQLRYLSLYRTNIERLPDSVSNLSNLQTLELGECYKLQKLPSDLGNLTSLRHLGLHLDWNVWDRETDPLFMPPGIGRLTSLQTLSRFNAGKQGGSMLGEIKNLKLRGKFCISKLENVGESDANEANLKDKSYSDSIMYHWSKQADNKEGEKEVIECLRPHKNLKHLWIENYNGARFPDWMTEYSSFVKLETLRLSGCSQCKALPCVGNFPQLSSLHIESLHGVENMDDVFFGSDDIEGFVSLETLSLIDMPVLQQLNIRGDHLSELTISCCPELSRVPHLPRTIVKLKITNCPELDWSTLPQLPNLQNLVVKKSRNPMEKVESFTSLSSLALSDIPLLVDWVPKGLRSLRQLKVHECREFVSWGKVEGLPDLVSLEFLDISSCSNFSSVEGLPVTLTEFRLNNCPSLKSLPLKIEDLKLLNILEIDNVPGLKEIPKLQQRCQKDGADWPNIQYIPNRNIEAVSPCWFKKIVRAITPRIGS